nr:MAG TPA: hypothetical protein [Caudoviricetes sp.]
MVCCPTFNIFATSLWLSSALTLAAAKDIFKSFIKSPPKILFIYLLCP